MVKLALANEPGGTRRFFARLFLISIFILSAFSELWSDMTVKVRPPLTTSSHPAHRIDVWY